MATKYKNRSAIPANNTGSRCMSEIFDRCIKSDQRLINSLYEKLRIQMSAEMASGYKPVDIAIALNRIAFDYQMLVLGAHSKSLDEIKGCD